MSVSMVGNITRDPELKFAGTGNAVLNFSIAQNRKYNDKNGKEQEEVSYFDVTCFGTTAENVANSVSKGVRVMVIGRLKQNSWTADDGAKRSKVEIIADEVGVSLRFSAALMAQTAGQVF